MPHSATHPVTVPVTRANAEPALPAPPERADLQARIEAWFDARHWQPFAFQREVWDACRRGESGLLHATTGSGKTYAVWLGALLRGGEPGARSAPPSTVLWLTPMRALAADTARALEAPLQDLGLPWTVETRTGDTSSSTRARQAKRLPTALVTTPESLSLLLTRADARRHLASVRTVIVDEWHELMGSKRGVQTQLALARLRGWCPDLVVWGLSATLGNLPEALEVLLGPGQPGRLVRGEVDKALAIDTMIPASMERFP